MTKLAVRLLGATSPVPTITHLFSGQENTPANNRTFSAVPLGVARSTRKIGVFVHISAPSALASYPTVRIAGITATRHGQVGPDMNNFSCFYSATVPLVTTGNIVLSFANTVNSCAISVFSIFDVKDAAPTINSTFATALTLSSALSVPAFGGLLAAAVTSGTSAATWTNINEQSDISGPPFSFTSARRVAQSTTATITSQVNWAANGTARLIVVSWR